MLKFEDFQTAYPLNVHRKSLDTQQLIFQQRDEILPWIEFERYELQRRQTEALETIAKDLGPLIRR